MPSSGTTAPPQPEITNVAPATTPLQAAPRAGEKEVSAMIGATRMKAIAFERYGGPEVLEPVELPTPGPAQAGVLVRVTAIGVNPADAKWRSGMFEQVAPLRFPYVPGYDIAGRVESGPGFPPGARVMAMLDLLAGGAYAEFAVLPSDRLAPIPTAMTDLVAAALPTASVTGVQLIDDHVRPAAGERVLVTGAVGAVGRFAVHAAKARGACVIAAVREDQRDAAFAIGADEVVVFGSDTPPARIDHVADTIGGGDVAAFCRSVGPGGRIRTVSITPIPSERLQVEPQFIQVRADAAQLASIGEAVALGDIILPVAEILPLEGAAEAHRLLEGGSTGGKIVLIP